MAEKVYSRTLVDGSGVLSLNKWQLNPGEAEALRRSVGSEEYSLRLNEGKGFSQSTYPTASWYFTIKEYKALFNSIRNKPDFETVRSTLVNVRSEESAAEARKTLEKFLH